MSRPLIIAGAGVVLLAGGAIWLWAERTPIAASYIDEALRSRNVPASYRLAHIGIRTHRIEAIRLGDPRAPDLTADWAEIELAIGLSGVTVHAVDAGGVRLHGRLVDGKLSLGTIDRLLPTTKGNQPFALPDMIFTARSLRADIATPQGLVQATLDGGGNLKDGFRGSLGLGADRLLSGGCITQGVTARLGLRVDSGRPAIRGMAAASGITCPGAIITAPRLSIDARGKTDLARWTGRLGLLEAGLAAGEASVGRLSGPIDFDASSTNISGKAQIAAERVLFGKSRADRLVLSADYRVEPRKGSAAVDGDIRLAGGRIDPAMIDGVARNLSAADATPVGPILAAWGEALRRAGRGVDGSAAFAFNQAGQGGSLRLDRLDLRSPGGARLLVRSEQSEGVGWRWPDGGIVVNASAEVSGGGLPTATISLRQTVPGAPMSGSATIAPFAGNGARLALAPVRFGPGPGNQTLVTTRVTMDGPLADGRIEGLSLPIGLAVDGRGALALNRSCAPLSFSRLALAGTVIGRSLLQLCPIDGALVGRTASGRMFGGARISTPRLRGRVGDQPLTMTARSIDAAVARPGFRVESLAVRLGDPANPTRLDVVSLDGAVSPQGLGGRFEGTAGKLAAVPLLLSEGAGKWALAGSRLTLDGGIRVADAETGSPRFHPLTANDVRLTLEGGRIAATATLREPRSNQPVSRVAVRHDLSTSKGDALLDVEQLRFGKALQPEAVTPLTLGMIANVNGSISGQGRIRWADGDVTSDGEFRTAGTNFAAAFGPVTGLKGEIRFTDLLGLVTAPDQTVTIAEINPGIAVTDGVIRYRILPDRKLAIRDGIWPFAGGTLTLEPTVLDMVQPVARRLTFRITGLDAATFVQQLEFKNISVTGKFDGVLPIVFDSGGGRIENGVLGVRPGGGTLSYVGDVTNAKLGRTARIAFDALKSMRYDRLTIDLNGSLDGEIVSQVRFDGTNDEPEETARRGGIIGRLLAPVTRLPFRFKITITAPFRGLVNSAQTFVDPSIVLRNTITGAAQPVSPTPGQASLPLAAPTLIQPR
ncbi:MAG: YdbH domain-containing protein [Pseudomonadota bacterium]